MCEKLVSVLIPSYNHERYIEDAIYSVINQDYKNIELIIVDDGSTDDTFEKVKKLKEVCSEKFINFEFMQKEHSGTCETMNLLLKKAKGDYITFIASDDQFLPKSISLMVKFLSENEDYALVTGISTIIDTEGKKCFLDKYLNLVYDSKDANWLNFSSHASDISRIDFNSSEFGLYSNIIVCNHITNGFLINHEKLKLINFSFTPSAPLEDYWLMLQLSKFYKFKFLEVETFCYRMHPTNTIRNKDLMSKIFFQTKLYELGTYVNNELESELLPMTESYLNFKQSYMKTCLTKYTFIKSQQEFINSVDSVCSFLKENNISSVYIYCANDIGISLYNRLKLYNYNIMGFFDMNPNISEVDSCKVRRYSRELVEKDSAIIVATNRHYNEIYEKIAKELVEKNVKLVQFSFDKYSKKFNC